jgi:lipopolysaccharide export system protein LptC
MDEGKPHYDKQSKTYFPTPHIHIFDNKGRENVRKLRSREYPK